MVSDELGDDRVCLALKTMPSSSNCRFNTAPDTCVTASAVAGHAGGIGLAPWPSVWLMPMHWEPDVPAVEFS